MVRQGLLRGQIDTYLLKPLGHPEERLYPLVSEILGTWARTARPRVPILKIVGERWASRSHELRDLLERASLPYELCPHDCDEGRRLLRDAGHAGCLPAVIFRDQCLADPTDGELARMLGAGTHPMGGLYDLVVVGAGPAGLATAVYGAADGLRTLVVERQVSGGQAGSSAPRASAAWKPSTWPDATDGTIERLAGAALFVLIGAGPHTGWLEKTLQRDERGHLLTGRHVVRGGTGEPAWPADRAPVTLETSLPGVFAAFDVRHNSPRDVAAAVADGAIAARAVYDYLNGE